MSFIESFDCWVSEVEKLIEYDESNGYLRPEDIIRILSKQEGKMARELDSNFKFISEISLNRYIKDRKMMATYIKMLRDENYDAQSYVESAGYDNESSFSTAFSKKFGMPPKKAQQLKDETLLEDPLSIASIICGSYSLKHSDNESEKVFGLPKETIERYYEIREFQSLYGLEDKYAELAVFLNEKMGIDLESAFKTIDIFVMDYMFDYPYDDDSLPVIEKYIKEEVPVVFIKHLYPDISLPELNNWYLYMKRHGGDILEEAPDFVRVFMDNVSVGMAYKELKELYNDYINDVQSKYSFREYIELIQEYGSIESYEEYMEEISNSFSENGFFLHDSINEYEDFWSAYDEKHFEDM